MGVFKLIGQPNKRTELCRALYQARSDMMFRYEELKLSGSQIELCVLDKGVVTRIPMSITHQCLISNPIDMKLSSDATGWICYSHNRLRRSCYDPEDARQITNFDVLLVRRLPTEYYLMPHNGCNNVTKLAFVGKRVVCELTTVAIDKIIKLQPFNSNKGLLRFIIFIICLLFLLLLLL